MSLSRSSRVVSFFEQALGEHDLDHLWDGLETRPIPLELARQRHPAYRLSSSKSDAFQAGAMCFDGRATDRVDDRIHLEAFAESVERRKRHTDLSPQSAEDEFPSPSASQDRKSTRLNSSHQITTLSLHDALPICQRHPAYRLSSSKSDAFQAGAMCFDGRATDRVDDRIHLEAFAESVERRKRHTDLSPQSAEDEFPSPSAS